MDTKEKLISLIKNSPSEKLQPIYQSVASELITTPISENHFKDSLKTQIDMSGYLLFNYISDTALVVKKGENLKLNFRGRDVELLVTSKTLIPDSYIVAGDQVVVIGRVCDDLCYAEVIANKEFYDLFTAIDTFSEKVYAMQYFCKLNTGVQNNIKNELGARVKNEFLESERYITDIKELNFKFRMCRNNYSLEQQADIEALFEKTRGSWSSAEERSKCALKYILNINQSTVEKIKFTKSELKSKVSKLIYKHDKVIDKIIETIIAAKYNASKGCAILLVGSPGTGKTAIPKAVGTALNLPYYKIPLGSCGTLLEIVGSAQQYDASDCGDVIKIFYKAKTTHLIMLLDEFDKAAKNIDGSKATIPFNDALSDENYFKDAFLGTNINTENTIWIATANSTEGIPEHLLNRMTVIHIDDYTLEEKIEISQNYILPKISDGFNMADFSISIQDELIEYIINNYCIDDGVRDVKKHLQSIINNVVSTLDEQGSFHKVDITRELIDEVLGESVNKADLEIVFRRNKDLYSPRIAEEIKSVIMKLHREDVTGDARLKAQKKLKYLIYSVPLGDGFLKFDKKEFLNKLNETHFGQTNAKLEIAKTLNISAVKGEAITDNKFLFVGGYGVGKTSLARSIAAASNAKFCKISLNGVADETVIKGSAETYKESDAGLIIKAINSMQTTKGVMLLDELDKLGNHNGVSVSNTLVDLLDDCGEFTDNFLGVTISLKNVLFIATCNDINAVDSVIRDRFTVIYLDGYTQNEKNQIIREYLIPKLIKELCPDNINLSFTSDAVELLKASYCTSFGVRDADKAVRKLIKDKLYTSEDEDEIKIGVKDVRKTLGNTPAKRGNFPQVIYPGLSKGLAVTGDNMGMAFAVETVLIPNDKSITITGLPKESTIDSVKLAVTYIKYNYPNLLDNCGIHTHFAEGGVQKDGPSAGVAILMSLLSAGLKKPIKEDVAYTGEINANGYVFNIGGTKEKIQGAQESGCTKVFIPEGNYNELTAEDLKLFSIEIIPIRHISQVIEIVFPESNVKTA